MTFQVTKLPLYRELRNIGHDFLFSAWTDRVLVYMHCVMPCNDM
jgi:hypothetical protein